MGPADTVTIVLRPAGGPHIAEQLLSGHYDPGSDVLMGAPREAMDAVLAYAHDAGLNILESDAGARRIVVSGTPEKLAASLSHLPADIAPHVLAVLGLDKGPVAQPRE